MTSMAPVNSLRMDSILERPKMPAVAQIPWHLTTMNLRSTTMGRALLHWKVAWMSQPVTSTQMRIQTMAVAILPKPDTIAQATASTTAMAMESATNSRSQVARRLRLATLTQEQRITMILVIMPNQGMTAMAIAS